MSVSQPPCPGATYTIRSGDTLFGIARSLGISLDALLRANPGINPEALRVGQVICLPVTPVPPTECPTGFERYTIMAGDTLFALARRFGTTVEAIQRANPGLDPNSLRVGQIICIPSPAPPPTECPAGFQRYTIVAGDTLFALARRFGTTVDALLRANPGIDPESLRVGQIICVPSVPAPPPPGQCPAGLVPYTIRSGDTLFALARATGTTVAEIQRNNPGIDPNNLRVGQIICLPRLPDTQPPPGECRPTDRRYVVQPGDTYFRVAQRFGVTVAAIQAANPGIDPNNLIVGMIICVPAP